MVEPNAVLVLICRHFAFVVDGSGIVCIRHVSASLLASRWPSGRVAAARACARARAPVDPAIAVARRCALARSRAKGEVEFARQSTFSALGARKSNSTASGKFGSTIAPLASPTWALPAIRPRLGLGSARGKSASLKGKAPVDGSRCLVTGGAPNPKRRRREPAQRRGWGSGEPERRRFRTAIGRAKAATWNEIYIGACSAKAQTHNS